MRQAVSFAAIGILNTAIDFAVFGSLMAIVVKPVVANVGAWCASFICSYTLNTIVTFRHRLRISNLMPFFTTSPLTLAVSTTCIALLASTNLGPWFAKILSVGISLGFFLARRFAFKMPNAAGANHR